MAQPGEPKNRSIKSVDTISKNETSEDVGKKVAYAKRRPRLPVLGKSAKKSNGG